MSRAWKTVARTLVTLAACWGAAAAQAQAQQPETVTYFFNGDCSSCAAEAGVDSFSVMARLTLQDYVPGEAIVAANVQSLWYTGSNRVDMFTLTGPADTLFAGRVFSTSTIESTLGQLGTAAGLPLAFSVEFSSGLFFRTLADGSWSVCAPRGAGYSANCFGGGADVGSGRWDITPVPEPSTMLLLAGGIAALSLLRRRLRLAYALAPIASARSR